MRRKQPTNGHAGFTLVQLVAGLAVVLVLGLAMGSLVTVQRAFTENQIVAGLRLRGQHTLDSIVTLVGQSVTTDAEFAALKPTTGINSHCVRFRLLQSVNNSTAQAVYDDALVVYVYGPDSGTNPSQGVIIGRGPDLSTIHAIGSGADGFLGTTDDDTSTAISGNMPAVQLLITSDYAPQTGDMFTVTVNPAPLGKLLTFTLRLNAKDRDGNFLLPNDLVFRERVALRQ